MTIPTTPRTSFKAFWAINLSQDISKIMKKDMEKDALVQIFMSTYAKAKEQFNKKSNKHMKIIEQDRLHKTLPSNTPLYNRNCK